MPENTVLPRRLQGATVGERIADAIELSGIKKAELARRVGKPWRRIHAWITGENRPSEANLRLLAEALPVTLDELLGVAAGQDPPFRTWAPFLGVLAESADELSADERTSLQSFVWPPGQEPTVADYFSLLALIRRPRPARIQ